MGPASRGAALGGIASPFDMLWQVSAHLASNAVVSPSSSRLQAVVSGGERRSTYNSTPISDTGSSYEAGWNNGIAKVSAPRASGTFNELAALTTQS